MDWFKAAEVVYVIEFWFFEWTLPGISTVETWATIGSGVVLALFAFVAFVRYRANVPTCDVIPLLHVGLDTRNRYEYATTQTG